MADTLIGIGGPFAASPSALLVRILSGFADPAAVDPLAAAGLLDPAMLFDAFTSARLIGLRPLLDRVFAVVAYPRQYLPQLHPGDLLLRRALGEPGLGHVAFIAGQNAYPRNEAHTGGLALESMLPGLYARVVEAGSRPHRLAHRFARRIAGAEGQLPADTLILRPRLSLRTRRGPAKLAEDIDVNRAVQANRQYAVQLGWGARVDDIDALLGLSGSPTDQDFAQAVSDWQSQHGLTSDGMLGPDTWTAMQPLLPAPPGPTPGPVPPPPPPSPSPMPPSGAPSLLPSLTMEPQKLKAFRFKYDTVLENCLNGTFTLRVTNPFETGRHVRKVQQALLALGYALPLHGADGVYGPETASAVSQFKTKEGIWPNDGVVGPKTMAALDAQFATEVPFPPPVLGPGDLTFDDFIEAVQAAESANASDTPEQFLTRLRQLYYPGTDPDGLTFREVAFDHLLPDAPFQLPNGTRRILKPAGMDPIFFGRLTMHAPENPIPGRPLDNPSPYVIDVTGVRIDVGHLLLTMDALLHPRSGEPYQTFGVPAIDPASWVADLGIAAVWAEQNGQPDAPKVLPLAPDGQPDLDGYYRMSAPDPDLFGDIDGFNVVSGWLAGKSLSSALISYYMDGDTAPGLYRHRFRWFLASQFGAMVPDASQWAAAAVKWQPRVDRFNDLFAAGAFGALTTLTPPPLRHWRYTPNVLTKFFQWLMAGQATEADRFD